MDFKRWAPLGLFLILAFAAAALGALATATSVDSWYPTLQKPTWNPPSWIFSPVWTALYLLMAIATWRAWRSGDAPAARRTVSLYSAQLTLNALWSILFFGMQRTGGAFVEIIVLWLMLVFIQIRYWRIERLAALLWLPYVLWVTYAMALNGAIWTLNR